MTLSDSLVTLFRRRVRTPYFTIRRLLKEEVYAYWRRRPLRAHQVLYESFSGSGMLCNPEAIFRALYRDAEFAGFRHVWVIRDRRQNASTMREFSRTRNVRFVHPNSFAYLRALATSRYLINNATFPPEFSKRSGQTYLNTWHGTPLKRMGFDIGDPATRVANVIRNLLSADYLLAANRFMHETLYESAYGLRQIYPGKIIEEGYPRIDHQFAGSAAESETLRRLEDAGLKLDGRKVILYAPTWKGTNFNAPQDDIAELLARLDALDALIDTRRYVVLLKTHQAVQPYAKAFGSLSARLVPNEIPTNAVLAITDILVTDYSSIFFDFLASDRPIIFYTPDIADYAGYRGLYLEQDTWPGAVVSTIADLGSELVALTVRGRDPEALERSRAMRERFAPHDDGNATGRIIDIVFRGHEDGYRIARAQRDSRPRILINGGSMRPNRITSSLLQLLDRIDYERFDVSLVFPENRRGAMRGQQKLINPGVRQFARVGAMNGSKFTHLARLRSWRRGDLRSHSTNRSQRQLWDDEWKRCFGDGEFDFVVDYSGYGPLWATLMLHAPGAECSIWLHGDLAGESRSVATHTGNPLTDLSGIFSLYREYDHLISATPAFLRVNAESLGAYAPAESFVSMAHEAIGSFYRAIGATGQ